MTLLRFGENLGPSRSSPRPSHSRMLSMELPDSSSSDTKSKKSPLRSLGDKLQLLALTRPAFVQYIDQIVDQLLANAAASDLPDGGVPTKGQSLLVDVDRGDEQTG